MYRKYLLGATTDNEIVFGQFDITTRNGYPEFTASFNTVKPFTEDEIEDAEEYYENLLDDCYSDADKYKLCEKFNCTPYELAEHLMDENGSEPMNMRDCSLFPETINVDGVDYYFESGSCGQHDTRNKMSEYVNKEVYDAIHTLWDNHHLKHVGDDIIKTVEKLQKQLNDLDVEEWVSDYIQREVA